MLISFINFLIVLFIFPSKNVESLVRSQQLIMWFVWCFLILESSLIQFPEMAFYNAEKNQIWKKPLKSWARAFHERIKIKSSPANSINRTMEQTTKPQVINLQRSWPFYSQLHVQKKHIIKKEAL
jgi:hypothetical protein